MKVIYGLGPLKARKTALAIGIFDGVHRGHQLLIKTMVAYARRHGQRAAVLTFFPHPAHVLRPDIRLPYLMSLGERLECIRQLGVEEVFVIRFNKTFARIDPRRFISDSLIGHLGVQSVFVGEDFRFGKDRGGDIALFKSYASRSSFHVRALKPFRLSGDIVSSSRIRRLIAEGDLLQAAKLLGRPFSFEGLVVKGDGRGKTLGFPTANVEGDAHPLVPHGVYAVRARLGAREYPGMANVGVRPSFKDKNPKTHVEVHLFDLDRRLYGRSIKVQFIKKVRDERRFPSIDALIAQITRDGTMVRRFLKVE